jgi:hypothetical protein
MPSDPSHQKEFEKQLSGTTNDRGYCLLLASTLENALDEALLYRLPNVKGSLRDKFYESEGPAGGFSRKITLAAALDILGPVSYRNFTLIRHIRNSFAHAKIPINFDTEQVAQVSNELTLIDPFFPEKQATADYEPEGNRERFHSVIARMMVLLSVYAGYSFKAEDGHQFDTSHGAGKPLP